MRATEFARSKIARNFYRLFNESGYTMTSCSEPRRQLLEKRHIRLIELNRLPGLELIPPSIRHATALHWFLKNLEAGRPTSPPSDWPTPPFPPPLDGDDGLAPIPPSPSPGFVAEPNFDATYTQNGSELYWVVTAAKAWRANRGKYPGWVIAPEDTQNRLLRDMDLNNTGMLRGLRNASALIRLLALREFLWRLDVALMPPPLEILELINTTVADVRTQVTAHEDGIDLTPTVVGQKLVPATTEENELWLSEHDTGMAWICLIHVLLRSARESNDVDGFNECLSLLKTQQDFDQKLWPRLCYERCLFALGQLDLVAAERALVEWKDSDGGDPYWGIRRAALMGEMGQLAEAKRIWLHALTEIKRSRRPDIDDVAALSREAWGLMLARPFSNVKDGAISFTHDIETQLFLEECQRRWKELYPLVGSPWHQLEELDAELEKEPARFGRYTTEKLTFDAGRRRSVRISSGNSWVSVAPAMRTLRLLDEAGLPPMLGYTDVSNTRRLKAAEWLKEFSPDRASVAFLRVGRISDDKDVDDFLSRVWVARLSNEQAKLLTDRALALLDMALPFYRAANNLQKTFWLERVKFSAELVSRLIIRASPPQTRETAKRVVAYYRDSAVDHIWLQKSFYNLFKRSFEVLNDDDRFSFLPDLVALPLPTESGPMIAWPTALQSFHTVKKRKFTRAQIDKNIDASISILLGALLDPDKNRYGEAARRLSTLHQMKLLSKGEAKLFADHIWDRIRPSGLPNNEILYDFMLLALPQPANFGGDLAIREAYLSPNTADPLDLPRAFRDSREYEKLISRLMTLVNAALGKLQGSRAFSISPEEAALLAGRIVSCINRTLPERDFLFGLTGRENVLRLAGDVLTFAVIPNLDISDVKTAALVMSCLDVLDNEGLPTLSSRIALTRINGERLDHVVSKLRERIRSHRAENVEEALTALDYWVVHKATLRVAAPPSELGLEVGFLVQDAWPPVLIQALNVSANLLRNPTWKKDATLIGLLIEGLGSLQAEAAYNRILTDVGRRSTIPVDDIPGVRAAAVKLATIMAKVTGRSDTVITNWLEAGRNDPLPEVRHGAVDDTEHNSV